MFRAFIHLRVLDHCTLGSNFELSGGQCLLIHLTILSMFSRPSLAYNYVQKGGLKSHSFHFNFLKVETTISNKKARMKLLPHRSYFHTST